MSELPDNILATNIAGFDDIDDEINCEMAADDLKTNTPKQSSQETGLSKRQIRKRKMFEKHREHRKAKRVEEKLRQKEKNFKVFQETGQTVRMKREYLKNASQRSVDINIVFDLSFSDLMSEKDLHKVAKQIHRCYSVNRASEKPLKIHLAGIDEKVKKAFNHCVPGYESWQISSQTSEAYEECFKKLMKENFSI